MTIRNAVSQFRLMLKDYTDDSIYTDEALYNLLNNQRLALINAYLDNEENVSDFDYEEYCIAVEKTKSHDCDCVSYGCDVLKSVNEIPRPVSQEHFQVNTLGRKDISKIMPELQKAYSKHPIRKSQMHYSIVNQKVVIWNNLNLKALIVKGIWADSTEWTGITLCDKTTGESYCIDNPLDLKFSIPPELFTICLQQAVSQLIPSMQILEDITNDSQSEIRS